MISSLQLFILLFVNVLCVQCWRPFALRFDQVECEKTSDFIAFTNCSVEAQTKLQNSLSFGLIFADDIVSPELDLMIAITRKNQPIFVLTNITHINGCDFLQQRGIFKILGIIRTELERFGNIPQKCPVPKNTEVFVHNLTMRPEHFPPYLPDGRFIVYTRLLEKNILGFQLRIEGNIISTSKNRGK